MSLDLDMDMGELFSKLFKKGKVTKELTKETPKIKSDNPYKKPILIGAVMLLFFGAFMAGVYSPYHSATMGKKTELSEKLDKKEEIANLETRAKKLESNLVATKQHYRDILEYFGDHEDLGYLYESVSSLALQNNLDVINIRQLDKARNKKVENSTEIQESQVELELRGRFNKYMSFKEDLSNEKALININYESIKTIQDKDAPGTVSAKMRVSIYTLDKTPYTDLLKRISKFETEVAAYE